MKEYLTPHFTLKELACRHCGEMLFSQTGLGHLEDLRVVYGRPMHIASGHRCPHHDEQVWSKYGGEGIYVPDRPHVVTDRDNITVDVRVFGDDALDLVVLAAQNGFTGIGVQQQGPHAGRFIHLDRLWATASRPRPWIWSY